MSTQLVVQNQAPDVDLVLADVEKTQKLCSMLMRTKHYAALGEVGIFAVVQKAKSIGINPLDALNGAMYFVQGKVELTANTMNYLIRAAGHSISKDTKSDKTICILHGKRADNGDTWTCSFSIEDARKAGIFRNQWEKYTEDMLFARALSRLARQLFPDVIKGCYVEGEIRDSVPFDAPVNSIDIKSEPKVEAPKIDTISEDQVNQLESLIGEDTEFRNQVLSFLKITEIDQIPVNLFDRIVKRAIERKKTIAVEPQEEVLEQEEAMGGV